jgi:hypothetical protein
LESNLPSQEGHFRCLNPLSERARNNHSRRVADDGFRRPEWLVRTWLVLFVADAWCGSSVRFIYAEEFEDPTRRWSWTRRSKRAFSGPTARMTDAVLLTCLIWGNGIHGIHVGLWTTWRIACTCGWQQKTIDYGLRTEHEYYRNAQSKPPSFLSASPVTSIRQETMSHRGTTAVLNRLVDSCPPTAVRLANHASKAVRRRPPEASVSLTAILPPALCWRDRRGAPRAQRDRLRRQAELQDPRNVGPASDAGDNRQRRFRHDAYHGCRVSRAPWSERDHSADWSDADREASTLLDLMCLCEAGD